MKLIQILMLSVKLCLNFKKNTRQCNYQNQQVKFYQGIRQHYMHAQLCPSLCNPMHQSPLGSSAYWSLLTRMLDWVIISYSRSSSLLGDWTHVSWVSCIGTQMFYHCATWEAPAMSPAYPTLYFLHLMFHFCVSVLFLSLHEICTIT